MAQCGVGTAWPSTWKKSTPVPVVPLPAVSWLSVPDGKYPVPRSHKPEYETLAAFGPMCLNDDMQSLIYANELCNLYGLDTISAGSTVAFAIECYENGLLTKADTDGIELTWGKCRCHYRAAQENVPSGRYRRSAGRRCSGGGA